MPRLGALLAKLERFDTYLAVLLQTLALTIKTFLPAVVAVIMIIFTTIILFICFACDDRYQCKWERVSFEVLNAIR